MRKFFTFLALAFAVMASAHEFTYNGIPYTVFDKDAKTCMVRPVLIRTSEPKYNDIKGDVILPEKVYDGDTEYTLVKIGSHAFFNCRELTNIELPSTISYIDAYAFSGCDTLQRIVIPEGVQSIQTCTFSSCRNLKKVVLPSTLKTICFNAFMSCTSLTKIELPEKLEKIERNAFAYCSSLRSINFPRLITKIPSSCFNSCGFVTFDIPDWVTTIEYGAFRYNSNLESVTIPASVTDIEGNVFYGCNSLKEVTCLAQTAPLLGLNSLYSCNNNACTLTIPDASEQSYIRAGWITDYYNVNNYGNYNGFSKAYTESGKKVVPVYIGETPRFVIDDVSKTAFVAPTAQSDHYSYINLPYYTMSSLEIPETINGYTVTGIAAFAFQNAKLESVKIPETVTEIGAGAFANDTCLLSIDIPESVVKIGGGAFRGGRKLSSVVLPSALTDIRDYTFSLCPINQIDFPKGLKKIGDSAFESNLLENVTLPDGLEFIGNWAFYTCRALKSVEIPQTLQDFGYASFQSCQALEKINIPLDITSISSGVFCDQLQVKKYIIPSSVETIGFQGLLNWVQGEVESPVGSDIYIGEGLKEIGYNGIDGKNIYITAQEPPMCNGPFTLFSAYIPYINVYVQGEEAKRRYESVYPWYLYNIKTMTEATEIKTDLVRVAGKAGATFQPKVTFVPADASMQEVTWTTTDPRVATVNSQGVITIANLATERRNARDAEDMVSTCKVIASSLYVDGPVAEVEVTNLTIEEASVMPISVDQAAKMPRHIYNMQGICVKQNATDDDLRALAPGIYIIDGKKHIVR